MLMQFIRKTTVGVAVSLLVTLLFSFGVTLGLQRVFGTPTAVKSALKQSGFYDTAVASGLDQAQKDQSKDQQQNSPVETKDQVPIDRPEVRAIIENAVSPKFLQQQSEGALDAVYAWLQGKTPTLAFTVDLGDAKTRLADGLASYVTTHVASLPPCTSAAQLPSNSDVDPFNATCVPPGFDVNKAANDARDQILHGDFLKDSKLTASSLKNDNGQTLDQQLHQMPKAYQHAVQAVYAAGAGAVLLALAIVFLSVSRRSGLKKVSITCIVVGAIVGLFGVLSSIGVQKASDQLAKTSGGDQPLQQHILGVAKLLINDVRFWWMLYGATLVVLGIATLVGMHFIKPRGGADKQRDEQVSQDDVIAAEPIAEDKDKPARAAATENTAPRPRPGRKLVQ